MAFRVSPQIFRLTLLPFSIIYRWVICVRNKFFDWGVYKQVKFNLPVISVGNITVGGTGKTPHTEYLLNLLKGKNSVGVLSRGYKRKTKGFILAGDNSTPDIVGDEPYQIFQKYRWASVAVCEKRVIGIESLLGIKRNLEVILLDDAYQHRYVKPGMSILLIDYNRPVYKDYLLPAGNLRESLHGINRANLIVVTKVSKEISDEERDYWHRRLKLTKNQHLYFSGFRYGNVLPVFNSEYAVSSLQELRDQNSTVLLVTGIAEPKPLLNYIKNSGLLVEIIRFADHHNFDVNDIQKIKTRFNAINNPEKIIITTEKDAVRLKHLDEYTEELKSKTYYLPIEVKILREQQNDFDNKILEYVGKNQKVG